MVGSKIFVGSVSRFKSLLTFLKFSWSNLKSKNIYLWWFRFCIINSKQPRLMEKNWRLSFNRGGSGSGSNRIWTRNPVLHYLKLLEKGAESGSGQTGTNLPNGICKCFHYSFTHSHSSPFTCTFLLSQLQKFSTDIRCFVGFNDILLVFLRYF